MILKLKREIESKREQVEILLANEKKNLQIIEKLKKSTLNSSQKETHSISLNDKLNLPFQAEK
jgi:hypothetical protein